MKCFRTNQPKTERLAIYYGYPSLINGSTSLDRAFDVFRNFAHIVLGSGIENLYHDEHRASRVLTHDLQMDGRMVYGYIPLGNTESILTSDLLIRVGQWKERIGVKGIFIDEFGFDYWADQDEMKARQAAVLNFCHRQGLVAIMNAWKVADILEAPWRRGDIYLCESFEPSQSFKLTALKPLRLKGLKVFGTSYDPSVTWPKQGLFDAFGFADDETYGAEGNTINLSRFSKG